MDVSKLANAESVGKRRIGVTVNGDRTEVSRHFENFTYFVIKLEVSDGTPKLWLYKH